jgi:hypothetical protein
MEVALYFRLSLLRSNKKIGGGLGCVADCLIGEERRERKVEHWLADSQSSGSSRTIFHAFPYFIKE